MGLTTEWIRVILAVIGVGGNGLLQSVSAPRHGALPWRFRASERSHGGRREDRPAAWGCAVLLFQNPSRFKGDRAGETKGDFCPAA